MTSENNLHKLCLIYGNQKLLVDETVDSIIEERLKDRPLNGPLKGSTQMNCLKQQENQGNKTLKIYL